MKAMQINKAEQGPRLIPVDLPKPEAGLGEILVQVHAAGVTPAELLWYPTTHTKSGTVRVGAVPGHEFSGVIAAVGKNVEDFEVGDEVYGLDNTGKLGQNLGKESTPNRVEIACRGV